jgi:DHA1 family inner membrane transport protein
MTTSDLAPGRAPALAALGLGSAAMIVIGLQPLLLSEIVDHQTALLAAIAEMLALAVGVALCALLLKPANLRAWAGGASAVCVAAGLGLLAHEPASVIPLRILAGLAGGVLIWITVGTIARQARPEPWAAAFFLIQSAGQVFAAAVAVALGPFGALGLAAGLSALGLAFALFCPPSLSELGRPSRAPSPKGWIALTALLLYFAGNSSLWFQMRPLATVQGLGEISGTVVLVTLAAQMVGAMAAIALAERLRRRTLFVIVVATGLAALWLLNSGPPAPLFIAAFGLAAFAALLLGASLFGILGAADPSRRAAAISPTAQFLAAAFGPIAGLLGLGPQPGLGVTALLLVAAWVCAFMSLPHVAASRGSA